MNKHPYATYIRFIKINQQMHEKNQEPNTWIASNLNSAFNFQSHAKKILHDIKISLNSNPKSKIIQN